MGHYRTTSISLTRAMLTHLPCHRKNDPLWRKHRIRPTLALTLEGQLRVRFGPFAGRSKNVRNLRIPAETGVEGLCSLMGVWGALLGVDASRCRYPLR
jgi:hypothetical protein